MTKELHDFMAKVNAQNIANIKHNYIGKTGKLIQRIFEKNGLYTDRQVMGIINEVKDFDGVQIGNKFCNFGDNNGFIVNISVDGKTVYDTSLIEHSLKKPPVNKDIREIIAVPHKESKQAYAITREINASMNK